MFGGNDVPGVMTASAMRVYLNRFAVAPGRAAAIFTTNDSGYLLAGDLEAAGVAVGAVVDSRSGSASPNYQGKARVFREAVVVEAHGRQEAVVRPNSIRRRDRDRLKPTLWRCRAASARSFRSRCIAAARRVW